MKKLLLPGLVAMVSVFAISCGETVRTDAGSANQTEIVPDGHNSANSLDWEGLYSGVLPCADCPGIETKLTIRDNETYRLTSRYLEKDDSVYVHQGTFKWDESGNVIILDGIQEAPSRYHVGEGRIFVLDMEGNRITGDLADHYVLTMQDPDAFLGTWKLVELHGKPYQKENDEARVPSLTFDGIGQMSGYAGCNQIGGAYELKDGLRISFDKVFSTLMACTSMEVEQEFLNMIESTDNYNLTDSTLVLNKARMAPLARFVKE